MKRTVGILITVLLVVGVAGVVSCKKDKARQIPYAYVNIYIKPNSTEYLELNAVGGWVYLTAASPSRGIIVYRRGPDDFVAFERTCPYDPDKDCARVEVEVSGSTAVDSCCMSRFILHDGSPFAGPASLPLKQYQTAYDGITLHITN
ncbi:MAG TPA: hypothetical protein P5550_08950 [Bacteroidales bacterium]|nr:hypothetical protein [Bacteroidales bacterium]HRZ76941.1 hypothetical protein [Bacteroidales bacterium]